MSKLKNRIGDYLLIVGLVFISAVLLLRPQEAVSAAKDGVLTALYIVIPSLFPFMVLSVLASKTGVSQRLGEGFGILMRPLFGVSGACAVPLLLGFIGGYPVGAKAISEAYKSGACSKKEAERLLLFINNAGPAFVFGIVGGAVFGSIKIGAILYAIQIISSVFIGLTFGTLSPIEDGSRKEKPRYEKTPFAGAFVSSVADAFATIWNVCGFVIFFSVLIRLLTVTELLPFFIRFFTRFGFEETTVRAVVSGLLEMTSGICALSPACASPSVIAAGASFLLGIGGLSVLCQISSVLKSAELSPKNAVIGMLLHGVLSAIASYIAFRNMSAETLAVSVFRPSEMGTLPEAAANILIVIALCLILCAVMLVISKKEYKQ